MDPVVKDEICWRLMKSVRKDARKRGLAYDEMTDEQKFSAFRRHSRRIAIAVKLEMGIA